MDIKHASVQQGTQVTSGSQRPKDFESFVGQETIKKVLFTALLSAKKQGHTLGHTLLCGRSGYGKTTLAGLISNNLGGSMKAITGYAITKPAEMISVLNNLQDGDVLFIDEIHRLRPAIEEVLYIAMEDYCIDMVMPDGSPVRVPLNSFTLIGATTKSESLSTPLKNRFIYSFHLEPYSKDQKIEIIKSSLKNNGVLLNDSKILTDLEKYVSSTPREITSLCIQLRDFLVVHYETSDDFVLTQSLWHIFKQTYELRAGGLTPLHQRYIAVLTQGEKGNAVGVKTIAAKLGVSQQALETDIEPLLFQLGLIEKTNKGRLLV